MLYWIRYPLIRFLFFFIAGIILSGLCPFKISFLISSFLGLLLIYISLIFIFKRKAFINFNLLLGIIAFILLSISGVIISLQQGSQNNRETLANNDSGFDAYACKIMNIKYEDSIHSTLIVKCRFICKHDNWKKFQAKINLLLTGDRINSTKIFRAGDLIMVKGSPDVIKKPLNPDQFDYAKYMANKNIYFQHYIRQNDLRVIAKGNSNNVYYLAGKLRSRCSSILAANIHDTELRTPGHQ